MGDAGVVLYALPLPKGVGMCSLRMGVEAFEPTRSPDYELQRMKIRRQWRRILIVFLGIAVSVGVQPASATDVEVQMPNDEFEKLDTFEAHVLNKADKVFSKGDYKRAAAEYDSFIVEFPRSRAIPYALMRKGRSLQHMDKRYEAAREYTQLVDYFPNAVRYAAAALAYKGWAYWENSDETKALTEWAKLAADKDYAKQPIAAGGLLKLAHHHRDEQRMDKAVDYYKSIAENFRKSAGHAAREAIEQVAYHYVRRDPNEPALRAFYKQVGTTHRHPSAVEQSVEELLNDQRYWDAVMYYIGRWGRFDSDQEGKRKRFYRYWAEQMEGRFAGWDDYQITLARYHFYHEGDRDKWMKRLDRQFERDYEQGDVDRVIKWIGLYSNFESKWKSYYNKLSLGKLDNPSIIKLVKTLFGRVGNDEMAANAFGHMNWQEISKDQLKHLRRLMWNESERLYMIVCQHYPDPDEGKYLMLQYHYVRRRQEPRHVKEGLELANQLVNSEHFAAGAIWRKAELLYQAGRYEEAIAAYQMADNPPENLKGIVSCYLRMGKPDRAISQLREIESFFKNEASWAAYRIAQVYNGQGKREQYIAELRGIMKKYAGSPEASDAHRHLEKMGIKIGGYVESSG